MLTHTNSQFESNLETLIYFYHETWPQSNELNNLVSLYQTFLTPSQLNDTIEHFKNYINLLDNFHPNRYTRKRLLFDNYFVTTTNKFKVLNKQLDSIIEKCKPKQTVNMKERLLTNLNFVVTKVCHFAHHNPELTTLIAASLLIDTSRNISPVIDLQKNLMNFTSELPVTNAGPLLFTSYKTLTVDHEGISAIDISQIPMNCYPKPVGATPGKICFLKDKIYYLKQLKGLKNKDTGAVLGEYNRQFLADNVDINVPNTSFVAETKNNVRVLSIASEHVPNFHRADELCTPEQGSLSCVYDRNKLVNAIGETGIARLAVANTFIKDLHSLNWGFANNKVIIIDADQSPFTLVEYFNWSADRFRDSKRGSIGFALTLENIQEMQSIYKNMRRLPLPILGEKIDIFRETYVTVLDAYIEVTKETLNQVGKLPNITSQTADPRINELFANNMRHIAQLKFEPTSHSPRP